MVAMLPQHALHKIVQKRDVVEEYGLMISLMGILRP